MPQKVIYKQIDRHIFVFALLYLYIVHLPVQSDQWICSEVITANSKDIIVTPLTSLLMILLARRRNICLLDSCYLDAQN